MPQQNGDRFERYAFRKQFDSKCILQPVSMAAVNSRQLEQCSERLLPY
jgi:hypothetical protein